MCEYFSCIVTNDFKAHWLPENPADHEAVIEKLKLPDIKLKNREFVRIEITPKNKANVTRVREDWQLKVDEEDSLPDWFLENKKKAEKACWLAWEESVQVNVGIGDEKKGKLTDGYIRLYGNSRAVLDGNSSAVLYGNSRAVLDGNSRAVLYGNSSAELYGNSRAELYESSSAELKSKTSVAMRNGKLHVHAEATVIKALKIEPEKES